LQGFLLAARSKTLAAIESFNGALAVDSALGNAWLGRGLCRIRRGDLKGGREDLLIAAAMEPQRAALRSYLAKAWSETGDDRRAFKELQLAKALDPNDPTPWLYSALLDEQDNRLNEAVRDLEKSQELNANRGVYRSRLLLDQDSAVRSANLARIYQEEGMNQVAVREAARGVSADYANYSAHLFLANSYDALRDPNEVNLRYETPAESEYLVANLLAPVGAGMLSQSISQQEYSRMFDRDGLHLTSTTEYLSRGAWSESAAQYGTIENTSYSLETQYRSDPGQRANNDIEERQFSIQIKQQLSPQASVYFQALAYDASGGDLVEYPSPSDANPGLRTHETQDPILVAGYHREWAPGNDTLFLVSRLNDEYSVSDPSQNTFFLDQFGGPPVKSADEFPANETYYSKLDIYSTELQQIWEHGDHNTIIGSRVQTGTIWTTVSQTSSDLPNNIVFFFPSSQLTPPQTIRSSFERLSFYGYDYWQVLPGLQLTGGMAYDWLEFPQDFRSAPISSQEERFGQFSPKAGFIWTPSSAAVVRFDFTRSLGGAGIDQSFSLEPSQVAGFNQSFRSIIPESIGGAEAGATFETFGLALDLKLSSATYVGLSGQILNSHVNRALGAFEFTDVPPASPATTPDPLGYTERDVLLTVDQLLGNRWSLHGSYALTQARISDHFNDITLTGANAAEVDNFYPESNQSALLHQVSLQLIYNHPTGFFADFQANWYGQSSQENGQNSLGYQSLSSADQFWQLNIFGGYRFPGRKAEFRVGFLNLTGQDYQLNPLTLYNELPHALTFTTRFQINY
jgi:hypothetical protein